MRSTSAGEKRYGIVLQAGFGTVCGDSTAYTTTANGQWLQCDHFALKSDLKLREDTVANGGRYQQNGDISVDANEAMPEFTITMPQIRNGHTDLFLAGWFQNVTEGTPSTAATPCSKQTYSIPIPGATQQPDFTADEGYFYTVTERLPTASESRSQKDCIVKALTFSHEPGGMLAVAAEMVGRGAVVKDANPSGAWTRDLTKGKQYATIVRHTINFGGGTTAVSLNGPWEIQLTQDVEKQGADSGDFENYGLINRGGRFTVNINADQYVVSAAAAAEAGTLVQFNFGFGTTTAADAGNVAGDLDFYWTGILDADPEHNNEGIMSGILTGKLVGTPSTSPITVKFGSANDRGW